MGKNCTILVAGEKNEMKIFLLLLIAYGAFCAVSTGPETIPDSSLAGVFEEIRNQSNFDDSTIDRFVTSILSFALDKEPPELFNLLSKSPREFSIFFWKVKGSFNGKNAKDIDGQFVVLRDIALFGRSWISQEYLRGQSELWNLIL